MNFDHTAAFCDKWQWQSWYVLYLTLYGRAFVEKLLLLNWFRQTMKISKPIRLFLSMLKNGTFKIKNRNANVKTDLPCLCYKQWARIFTQQSFPHKSALSNLIGLAFSAKPKPVWNWRLLLTKLSLSHFCAILLKI